VREIYFLRFLRRFWGNYISWRGFQVRSERMFLGKTEVSERSEDSGVVVDRGLRIGLVVSWKARARARVRVATQCTGERASERAKQTGNCRAGRYILVASW